MVNREQAGFRIRTVIIEPSPTEEVSLASELEFAAGDEFLLQTVSDLDGARAVLAEGGIDCVITRHDPPEIDGVTILSGLRKEYPELPVLIAAGGAHADQVLDSSATGIIDMTSGDIHGGFIANQIESVVSRVRERKEQEAQLQASQETLQRLHRITSNPDLSYREQLHRLLGFGADVFGMDIAFLSHIDAESNEFEVVAAQGEHELIQAGLTSELSKTYCRRTIAGETDSPYAVQNASEEMGEDPAFEKFELGCYMGARIDVNGELYGTLCFADDDPHRSEFTEGEEALIEIMAQWLRQQLQQQEYREELESARDELARTLERVDDGFFNVDTGWHVSYSNEAGAGMLRQAMDLDDGADVLGRHLWENIPAAVETTFYEKYHEAFETQESVSFEEHFPPLDVWFEVRAYPDEDGLSGYFTDITERKQQERELERFQNLPNQPERVAEVGGWEIDTETMGVFWTDYLFELLGVDSDEEPSLDESLNVYLEEDRPIIEQAVDEAIESTEPFDVDLRYRRSENEVRWLRVQGEPITDDTGEVVMVRGAAQDVTERQDREQTLNDLLSASRAFIEVTDETELVSVLLDEVGGVFKHGITSVRLHDPESGTLPPTRYSAQARANIDDPPVFADDEGPAGRAFQSQEPVVVDDLSGATGVDYGPVESGMFLPLGEYGVLGIGSTASNAFEEGDAALVELLAMTAVSAFDRLEREREMRRLQRALDRLDEKVFLLDEDGVLTFVTEPLATYLGREPAELQGSSLSELVPSSGVSTYEAALERVRTSTTNGRETVETELRTGDGDVRPVEFEFSATTTESDDVAIAGVVHEISELAATRSHLEAERDRFKAIADTTFDLLFRFDRDGRFTYVSSASERILGYAPDELVGEPFAEYSTEESASKAMAAFESVLDGGDIEDVELDILTADGGTVTLEVNGTPAIEDGDIVGVHGVARDITDRKETLRELQIKDRAIDEAQAGITLADATRPDEPLVYVNHGFEEMTGYDASSATGRNCRFLQGERTDPSAVATLRDHIDASEPVSVELVNYRNDGTPFWNQVRITPVRDGAGAVTHFLGIQNDVTEQKRWEQLFEVLNRVLRHNLRNDLGVVSGLGALLANRVHENNAEIGQTIERKADELLSLAQKARNLEAIASRDAEPERIDVDSVLSAVVTPYRREYPDVTVDVSVRTDRALCAGGEIEEALSELVENAVKHNTAEEPRVTIDVRDEDEWVVVSVEDNGPGINDMEANVISKGEEQALEHGSGLGLWLINWVVTRYGGSFQIRQREGPDSGTRATVRLPGLAEGESVETVAKRPTILFW